MSAKVSRFRKEAGTTLNLSDNRKNILLAFSSGLLLTGSFPKFGSLWVAWVALVPLLFAIRNVPTGKRFRLGLLAGVVHYLTLMYWLVITMETYGGLPWYASVGFLVLLCAYLALYVGGFTAFLGLLAPTPLRCLGAAPALWVFLEFIRAKALTGFPWELLGYTQYKALQVIQISDIFGVYGVSFLVVAVNASLFLIILFAGKGIWRRRTATRKEAIAAGLSAGLLLAAAVCYGVIRMHTIHLEAGNAPRVKASVLQGNIAQNVKWDPEFKEATIATYLRLTRQAAGEAPDLIVWPETATPFYFQRAPNMTRRIEDGIRKAGAYFIIGSPAAEEVGDKVRYYNSAYLIAPDGTVSDRYDKQHLVPFGEYVPWRKLLWFVDKIVPGQMDFSSGPLGMVAPWKKGGLGIQICYEMIFPSLSRHAVRNGADLLVNITNDAWFGKSSAPHQLLSMVAFRAVENRRSVVRSANTGISGFVDPTGRILAQTPLFEEAALTRSVPILKEKTIYTRWGDWLPAGCGIWIALLVINCIAANRRRNLTAGKENHHVL